MLPRDGGGNKEWWSEREKGAGLAKIELVGVSFYLGWLRERERERERERKACG